MFLMESSLPGPCQWPGPSHSSPGVTGSDQITGTETDVRSVCSMSGGHEDQEDAVTTCREVFDEASEPTDKGWTMIALLLRLWSLPSLQYNYTWMTHVIIDQFSMFCKTLSAEVSSKHQRKHDIIFQISLELHEYAGRLGIDVEKERHLLYIAREGLLAELPGGWKPWYNTY